MVYACLANRYLVGINVRQRRPSLRKDPPSLQIESALWSGQRGDQKIKTVDLFLV